MKVNTIKLEWKALDTIFEAIFLKVLGKPIQCTVDFDSYDYWGVRFVDYEMSVDEIETVCSYVHANEKERKDAFPVEGASVSRDFGAGISSKLLSNHLGYTWKKQFADEDALYLIECAGMEKKIYVIYCDSPDDICFMLGYIEGTEEDAEKYCKEHNATITCPLNMVEWEKLDKLNQSSK